MDKTNQAEQAIKELVEREQHRAPQVFPHTSDEMAAMYGVSKGTAQKIMRRYLTPNGRRWFFRHKESHE
jgi:DNA-binding IscR family transcriptional regulator